MVKGKVQKGEREETHQKGCDKKEMINFKGGRDHEKVKRGRNDRKKNIF